MQTHSHHALSLEQQKQFERDGYIVIPRLFTNGEVDAIRDAFMEANADGPIPNLSEIGSHYKPDDPLAFYPRMMHPHRHPELPIGTLAKETMLDPRVEAVLKDLFQEEPAAVQSMFYFKPPGARGQDLHQDNYYLRVKPGTCIAAWLAVDAADPHNGGMVVVPGSNHTEVVCPEKADSTRFFTSDHVSIPEGMAEVPLELNAGDVLFFNGSVIHGSYPNSSTDRFRRAFICHYVPVSSAALSHYYTEPTTFNGEVVGIPASADGGPCGTAEAVMGPH